MTFGAPQIQALINAGMGYASAVLGTPTQVFRPTGPTNPLAGPPVATLNASFNTSAKFDAVKPSDYPNPKLFGLFDRTLTLSGDYLVNGADTYFIASQDLNQSTMCVQCNRVITLFRASAAASGAAGFGSVPYSGNGGAQDANDVTVLSGWPVSLLQGTKGERGVAQLPDDTRAPWVAVLLPNLPGGVTIAYADQIRDDLGSKYIVSSAEQSELGWRLTAAYAGT